MWKESLIARFSHQRRSSSQGTPLISSEPSSRPLSTASLDSVPQFHQLDGEGEQPCDGPSAQVPAVTDRRAVTTTTNLVDNAANGRPAPDSLPVAPKLDVVPAQQAAHDIEAIRSLRTRSVRSFFMEELDTAKAAGPLSAYCFMTGFIDAISFSAIFIWCAFQTGNSVQLALAVARLISSQNDRAFHIPDQQALCAVLCFVFGAFLGRIGDKVGPKTRAWMTLGTFIQTLFTMAAAITIWKSGSGSIAANRGDAAWRDTTSFVTVGFMSASMGLQGIMGKRLNTQFTTTVVLTSTWCELVTEPQLFNFRRLVASRDHKIMAILFLFLGAFTGRSILQSIGSGGTLGVGTGLRFVITLWWLLVPAKKAT